MKNDYNKNTFWSCKNEETGDMKFFMKIDKEFIEVDRDVYNVCFNSYIKCLRDNRKEYGSTYSLDVYEDSTSFSEVFASEIDVENDVLTSIEIQRLYKEINLLNNHEKNIIISILIEGQSMRMLAKSLNIPVTTLQDKKVRILSKLKEKLKK